MARHEYACVCECGNEHVAYTDVWEGPLLPNGQMYTQQHWDILEREQTPMQRMFKEIYSQQISHQLAAEAGVLNYMNRNR